MCWLELHLYPFTGNSSSPFLSEVASLSDSQYFWLCKADFIPLPPQKAGDPSLTSQKIPSFLPVLSCSVVYDSL